MDPRQFEALEAAIRFKIAAEQVALEAKAKEDAAAKEYQKIRTELLAGSAGQLPLEPLSGELGPSPATPDRSVIRNVAGYFETHVGHDVRIEEISEHLGGVPASSVRSALSRLVALNKIKKVGRGTYVSLTGGSA